MGWHDDSKPPTIVNETQNLTLPTKKKEDAKAKPNSKNAPMFEEESNDLMGWDNSDTPENPYVQVKSNPLLGKPIQAVIHTKQNKMEETGGLKRESVQNTQKVQNVRSRYEQEEDLSGWNN